MEINLTKTKVIVFRNGGVMSKSEKFLYRGENVKIVTYYRYLGLIFTSRNFWSKALLSTVAAQAKKALSIVRRMIWNLGHPKAEVLLKFRWQDYIYSLSWSRTPGIRTRSPNSTSRLPLYIQYEKRYVKCWFKLLKEAENDKKSKNWKPKNQLVCD